MIRLKSSAVLIALLMGALLTALLSLTVISTNQTVSKIFSSQDRPVAISAANSGLEIGMEKYNKSIEQGHADFKPSGGELFKVGNKRAGYKTNLKMNSLTYGREFTKSDWLNSPKIARDQQAFLMKANQEINIDLDYLFKYADKPNRIDLRFSNFFKEQGETLAVSNNKLKADYALVDKANRDKVISSETTQSLGETLSVKSLSFCSEMNSKCTLKIKAGGQSGEWVFLKIQARSIKGVIPSTNNPPGTLEVSSTGTFGRSEVMIDKKFSGLGGELLGIDQVVVK